MIEETAMFYASARNQVQLSEVSDLDTESFVSVDKVGTHKPDGWFRHGDYELVSDKDGIWHLNYRPHVLLPNGQYDTSLFIDDVNPDDVYDFLEPPKENNI